jgi:hypothetical protein
VNCAEARDLLSPHLDGLAPADVDAHLASCAACTADFARLRDLRGLLRAFEEDEEISPDPAVLSRRVHEAARTPAAHPLRGLLIATAVVAALGAATPIAIVLAGRTAASSKTTTHTAPPLIEEGGTLTIRLNEPDQALLDKVTTFFKECPLTVEETRDKDGRSIEVRCHGPTSAEWNAFKKRIDAFLVGLRVTSGSWEWRSGRRP